MNLPSKTAWLLVMCAAILPLRAEDWTTSDGRVYHDVKVTKEEADAVTILHKDGGALIPLAQLPASLQERFHYDAAKAKAAATARAKADAASAAALKTETAQGNALKKKKEAQYDAAKKASTPKAEARRMMPVEPGVLETDKKQNNDALNPPKK